MAGYIEAETGEGSIDAELIEKNPAADTHCTLVAEGGDVRLYLPAELRASIEVVLVVERRVGGDYRIFSDFPLATAGESTRRITGSGTVNGGGDQIFISTVNGDIRIKKLRR